MAAVLRTAARITAKAHYSEEFSQSNERVKVLISHFENWLKCVKKYLTAVEALNVASGTAINHSLEWSEGSTVVAPTFSSIVKIVETVNQKLQTERNNVKWRYTKDLVEPLESLLAGELATARRLKDEFRDIQLQLQSTERVLADLKASKSVPRNPTENLEKELTYWERAREAERRFLQSDNAIKDALFKKEFCVPDCFGALLAAESTIAHTSASEFAAFQEHLNQTEELSIHKARDEADQASVRDLEAREARKIRFDTRWHELVRMISSPDLILVQSICSTAGTKSDQLLESIIRILDAHHETLPLIRVGIQLEAESTTSEGSLFRGNSTATKLMSAFTRLTGRPYLQSTLKALLHEVQSSPEGYEVDPSKVKGGESVEANMAKLLDTSLRFLETILGSLDNCPLAFRYLARVLRAEVCHKFPDAKYSSVGGFLFLRFFCPAILAPESCGLSLSGVPDAKARRPLILIGKVLQNLSNNVRFGGKEAFMAPVNEFIDQNLPRLNEFFDVVVDVDEEVASEYPPLTNLDEVEQRQLPEIFQILTDNLEAVIKSLISWKNEEAIPNLLQMLAQLRVVIDQGPPNAQQTFLPSLPTKLTAPYLNSGFNFEQAIAASSSPGLGSLRSGVPSSLAVQSPSSSSSSSSSFASSSSSFSSSPSSSSSFATDSPLRASTSGASLAMSFPSSPSSSSSSSSSPPSASPTSSLLHSAPSPSPTQPFYEQPAAAPPRGRGLPAQRMIRNSSAIQLSRRSIGGLPPLPPPMPPRSASTAEEHADALPPRPAPRQQGQMSSSFHGVSSPSAAMAPTSSPSPALPARPRTLMGPSFQGALRSDAEISGAASPATHLPTLPPRRGAMTPPQPGQQHQPGVLLRGRPPIGRAAPSRPPPAVPPR